MAVSLRLEQIGDVLPLKDRDASFNSSNLESRNYMGSP